MSTCFCMRWGSFHYGIDLAAPLVAADKPAWDWHVTRVTGFGDVGIELLDGWPTFVERDVVALRRRSARCRLRDEMADLARAQRIGDVDDPQAAAEPNGIDDGARHTFAELVRPEAGAARAAEGVVFSDERARLRQDLDAVIVAVGDDQPAQPLCDLDRAGLVRPQHDAAPFFLFHGRLGEIGRAHV